MSTHEQIQTQNQDPGHQAALTNIARHMADSYHSTPGVQPISEEQLEEDSRVFAEAVLAIISLSGVQNLLPGVKELVSESAEKENLRAEVGEERYGLYIRKVREGMEAAETEESKATHQRWQGQVNKFLQAISQPELPESWLDEFSAARQAVIKVEQEEVNGATEATGKNAEIQEAFMGREEDLQRLISMTRGEVEANVDYKFAFNLTSAIASELAQAGQAADRAGDIAVTGTVESPQ